MAPAAGFANEAQARRLHAQALLTDSTDLSDVNSPSAEIVSCTAKNHFYRAKRDPVRVFKTEFLLSYLSEPRLRARIRRGLLKVEQLHALARDIYYGQRGRINARELHEQMNSCSCVTLLLACVVYWQAKEISRVLKMGIPEGEDINMSLLEHVSPIEWENVILYDQYVLNPDDIR
jgi:TnpA family transposase